MATTTTTMAAAKSLLTSSSSFGFSGAGFLTAYHLGVADCLVKHKKVLRPGQVPKQNTANIPILTGVSGGALVAAAISIGIRPEDGMDAMAEIVRRTRTTGGIMDHLRPGFSLIDQVEDMLLELTRDADDDLVLRRITHPTNNTDRGLLRIGMTDSSYFPKFAHPNAYVYADDFESVDEILAACILSSYIPGLTGPALGNSVTNSAVQRATLQVRKMLERGSIKDQNGSPVRSLRRPDGKFWDGGLANTFPVVDSSTCLVTPFAGRFANSSISPLGAPSWSGPFEWRRRRNKDHSDGADLNRVRLDVSFGNVHALRCIAFSSEYQILESWFARGHDDALRYLKQNGLETTTHAISATMTDDVPPRATATAEVAA